MVKSNDAVLVLMQQTASSSDPFTDLPAHVALASSFLFWMHSDFVNNVFISDLRKLPSVCFRESNV